MNEASSGKDPTSSPDGLAIFQTYTNLINSEREALWARHNALVLANSLIIGALAISPAALWGNNGQHLRCSALASSLRRMVSNDVSGMVGDAAAPRSRCANGSNIRVAP
jgi:hypothetical protein